MTYTLPIGSVSFGTKRTEDLLSAFEREIRKAAKSDPLNSSTNGWIVDYNKLEDYFDIYKAEYLLNDAFDILNDLCPPHCYFGNRWGNGADYGVWPCWDSLNELPKVNCLSELEELPADEIEAVYVNDYGDTMLYARKGSEWKSVW